MGTPAVELSVVVPVYRSRDCVPELLRRLAAQLPLLCGTYELILVDDDSPDDTWEVIRRELPAYPFCRALRLMRNRGQIAATLCGLAQSRGAIVVTMDDDLQHPPEQIAALLRPLREGPAPDCVFGHFPERHHRLYRRLGSRAVRALHALAFGLPKGVQPSSFRALSRPLVEAILEHPTRTPSLTSLICQTTRRMVSVPVAHAARHAGRSNYTLARQFRLAFDNICGSSTLPLKAVSVCGLVLCAGSFLHIAVVLWRYCNDRISVPGWTTLAVLQPFLAGVTLLALGVFGEYMIRILREVRGAPRFVVREQTGPPCSGSGAGAGLERAGSTGDGEG
ncbi:MAG: glycosyltransferase family 2 protein [Lentisphaeria bacterium]|nr:glycosyltransferase family 2 protein [Lentisphaeria bacterium]